MRKPNLQTTGLGCQLMIRKVVVSLDTFIELRSLGKLFCHKLRRILNEAIKLLACIIICNYRCAFGMSLQKAHDSDCIAFNTDPMNGKDLK